MNSIWNVKDKTWLKERRERWKGIQKQLKTIVPYDLLNKKEIRFHKSYFLKGDLLPYDQQWVDEGFRIDKKAYKEIFQCRL